MDRPFDGIGLDDPARLIGKQVDRVGRVVPEQVVGPRARLALGVDVPAAEEVGLHIHLLDGEFAGPDPVVHVLVRGIEAAGVAHHAHQPGFLLLGDHRLRVGPAVGQRDFDLDVLARLHAGDGLRGVHLGRRAQDHRVDIGPRQRFAQIGARMARAIFGRDGSGLPGLTADHRNDFDAVDSLEAVEVLFAKGAGTDQGNTHESTPESLQGCPPSGGRNCWFGHQHQMPDRGVRTGNVIVTVEQSRARAQRPAHDQPHDHLDPFRSGLAQVFDMGIQRAASDSPTSMSMKALSHSRLSRPARLP
jgi:hypothetical protein